MQDAGQSKTPRRDRRSVRVPVSLREERRQAIFSLRSTGLTIQAIADQLGIDDNTVRSALAVTGDPCPLRARRPTPCIFEGCNRPRASKAGYCYSHARQLRLTGTVTPFHSRLKQQQETRHEREQAIFSLRSTGLTMQAIADRLGISLTTVQQGALRHGRPVPAGLHWSEAVQHRRLRPAVQLRPGRLLLNTRTTTKTRIAARP